ncbi:KinB-signaling pathway activation protein [Brevibacillus dissolubilis]|uniref:KinB-signaling pathway activation protein n=1 Tax=Brevibacillus dissolubilis TaxID=1844116 RepID=UPI0011169B68|nr:KinB-signaling pathway activation protein [Brevibacillus dissolubilis]
MNLRNYGWLFGTTLLIGALGGLIAGFLIAPDKLLDGSMANLAMGSLMNILFGLTISIVAQMGFFAYMLFNSTVLGMFRNSSVWRTVQIFLVLFVFFDMVYLRYTSLGGDSIWPYFFEPTLLLLVTLVVAYAKVKVTNASAWVPSIFFLYVVTALEWIPGLKQDDVGALSMLIPLFLCNAWQIMQLHRLVKKES